MNIEELKEVIKLSELEIEMLYNDEIDHEKETLLKEKEKLEISIERRNYYQMKTMLIRRS